MSEISKTSYFVVETLKTNPLVNTITFEKTAEMDWNKQNIYPLVNIDVISSNPTDENVEVTFILTAVQERDVDNEMEADKLFGSNLIDNLNETHQILNKLLRVILNNHNDDDIDVVQYTNIRFLKNFRGALDGSQMDVVLTIPNSGGGC